MAPSRRCCRDILAQERLENVGFVLPELNCRVALACFITAFEIIDAGGIKAIAPPSSGSTAAHGSAGGDTSPGRA